MIGKRKLIVILGALIFSFGMFSVGFGYWTDQLNLEGDANVKLSIKVTDDIINVEYTSSDAVQLMENQIAPDPASEPLTDSSELAEQPTGDPAVPDSPSEPPTVDPAVPDSPPEQPTVDTEVPDSPSEQPTDSSEPADTDSSSPNASEGVNTEDTASPSGTGETSMTQE